MKRVNVSLSLSLSKTSAREYIYNRRDDARESLSATRGKLLCCGCNWFFTLEIKSYFRSDSGKKNCLHFISLATQPYRRYSNKTCVSSTIPQIINI